MSRLLKTGIIQQANVGDTAENRRRLGEKIRLLASQGAQLIVNQELHDSLYFCQTENVDHCSLAVAIPSETTEFYAELARETGCVIVTSLFERRAPGPERTGLTPVTSQISPFIVFFATLLAVCILRRLRILRVAQ